MEDTDKLDIQINETNTGSTTYTDTLELIVNGSVVDTQSVTVEPGETAAVTLSYDTIDESPGEDLSVTVRGDHDSEHGTVEIVEPPENRVRLDNETVSYESGSTDTPTIAGTVTNEGGANATETYDLALDVANGSVRTKRSDRPGLDAGESSSFSFDLNGENLSTLDVGTHPITVTESFTDDVAKGSLTITENESEGEIVEDTETEEEGDKEEDSVTTQEPTESGDDTETETVTDEDSGSGSSTGSTSGGGGSTSGGGGGTLGGGSATGAEPVPEPNETVPPPVRGYVGDGDVALAEPILTVGRGDVAPITVNRDDVAEGGALLVGKDSAMEYGAAIHVETFGEAESITVLFNTYTAGTTAAPVVELDAASLEAGASIGFDPERDQTGPIGRIGTGEYSLVASTAPHPETAERNPSDVGVLVIEPRGNAEATTWTTSRRTAKAIRDADDPAAAMAAGSRDGTVTRRDRIAHGDVAILEVRATGLSGLLALAGRERGTRNATKRLRTATDPGWSGAGVGGKSSGEGGSRAAVELDMGETPTSAGTRGDRRTVDIESDGVSVATAGDRDRVYLLVNTARFAFEDGTSVDPTDSTTFRVDVRVPDARSSSGEAMTVPGRIGGVGRPGGSSSRGNERFERPAGEMRTASKRAVTGIGSGSEYGTGVPSTSAFAIDRRSATTTFSVVERDVEFREDPYDAAPTSGRTFEGETSIAPGTPITVDVRPESRTEATLERVASDGVVAGDGSWSAEVDLSTGSPGDRYRVHVRRAGIREERASVPGTILGIEQETTAEPIPGGSGSEGSREGSTTTDPGTTPNVGADPTGPIAAGTEAVRGRIDPEILLSMLVILLFLVGIYHGRTM